MKRLLGTLIVLAIPALSAGPNLAKHWKTSKEYTIAVAEKMPEQGYDFRPNAAQMTFAQQLVHIAEANGFFISTLTGAKSPVAKPEKLDKASVIKMLNDSFDWDIKSIEGLTPEQLSKQVKLEGGMMSGLEAILLAMDHTTHHRGQCIVYLRARDIAPPDYQF
ncbi:MAG: DinB family protein [Acidobacteriota bacterium]